ncbi:TetR/AcrR family transcriptional regulator [Bacteroidales bacterium OttesenSCG-928-M06]|nr:TetR/AcrR family transcriptional regulator [Bacteroidales bacterium OttesenSCG-928-M06]
MQDKKAYIIEKAFEVFVAKGYDSTSMTVLHQELNISRGAMYLYFPSKDDLFIAVIDKYIFGLLEKLQFDTKVNIEELSLTDRIDLSYKQMQKIGKFLDSIENMEVKFLNYTALTIQAAKKYPDFIEKMKTYRDNSRKSWRKTLRKAVETGEIKEDADIDVLAKFFSKRTNFLVEESDEGSGFFIKGIKSGKKIVNYIYSLIKK